MDQMGAGGMAATAAPGLPGVGANLAKLRAILELARTMQSSLTIEDVLASVVDAASAITGAERGFLLLRSGEELETRVARRRDGRPLADSDLQVPRQVLRQALERRRELFQMNFDPYGGGQAATSRSVADLELRSVVCVPLVRIRTGQSEATSMLSTASETAGVLYLRFAGSGGGPGSGEPGIDSGTRHRGLHGARERAAARGGARSSRGSTRSSRLARAIQQSLLPRALPASDGWLRAAGSSAASRMVGGDYFDVAQVNPNCWSAVVADVSGKGVGSPRCWPALLQGALIASSEKAPRCLATAWRGLNSFLIERTGGREVCDGFLLPCWSAAACVSYVNAAHCPPLVVRPGSALYSLDATATPVGLLEHAEYPASEVRLEAGDKLVIYTDGITEAQNAAGGFSGKRRLRETVTAHAAESCQSLHDALLAGVSAFTGGSGHRSPSSGGGSAARADEARNEVGVATSALNEYLATERIVLGSLAFSLRGQSKCPEALSLEQRTIDW